MEKVAIVTGATGQDGSYLCELLISKGYTVIGTMRRTISEESERLKFLTKIMDNQKFILEDCDIQDASTDEVYNLAAQSHVGNSFTSPMTTIQINTVGPLNFLEAIKSINPRIRFYQASTSEMFGDNVICPQNENSEFSPVSPYACAKLASHHLVGTYRKAYGIYACSGILFNHESPRRGENFVTRKITKAAARIKLGLQSELRLGNIDAYRDWGYAKDYVVAMWMMLQQDEPDDYLVATGKTTSVRDFMNIVFTEAGLNVDDHLVIDPKFYRPCEVPKLWGDPAKAKRILGWIPKTTFRELAVKMYKSDYKLEKQNV